MKPIDLVETERRGAVGHLWLNRPEALNALSPDMNRAITAALLELDADPALRIIVIAGRGRVFCAGADRKGLQRLGDATVDEIGQALREGAALARAIIDARCVVVSAVHGHCIGGGLSIALASDICLAAEGTQFFLPEVGLGLPLMWGSSVHLMMTMGVHRTKFLTLTDSRFDAAAAERQGLVASIVVPGELLAHADRLADALAARPAAALLAQKRLCNRVLTAMMTLSGDEVQLGLDCVAALRARADRG